MHRTGLRALVGGVEVDIPYGTFVGFQFLRYNSTTGLIETAAAGGGGITGPGTTVVGDIVTWNSTTGAVVADSGVTIASINASIAAKGDFSGPASSVTGNVVSFNGTTGKLGQDSGRLAANLVEAFSTTVGNLAAWTSASPPTIGATVVTATQLQQLSGMTVPSLSQRVLGSELPTIAAAGATSNTAYFVYLGRVINSPTINRVEFFVATAGATYTPTATGCEVGLFSSPSAPNRAGQTLTKLVSGTVATPLAVGLNRNTTAFGTVVAGGTHLWAGWRAQATTMPTLFGHTADMNDGMILTFPAAAVFSATASYAAGASAASITWQAPMLRATLD